MSAFASRALDVQDGSRTAPWAGRALLGVTLVLVAFGVLAVYSATAVMAESRGLPADRFLVDQLLHVVAGLVALGVGRAVDYRVWRRLAWPAMAAAFVALAAVVVPGTEAVAPRVNGARRWLDVGVTFQPSEAAKFAVVAWTAALAVKKQARLHSFRYGMLPFLLVVGAACGLVLLEPHLSAAMILAVLAGVVLFAAGARLGHFLLLTGAAVPLLWDQIVTTGYRMSRVTAFLEPATSEAGYQLRQSLIAVGSGGLFGVGFGESRQKLYYLPEPQNDFVFPIVAEEWGFVGAALLIGLFLAWTLLALRIASAAPDLFGRLLAVGLTAIVAVGAFGHFGVTLGLLPTTGVNLPFVSAGGTHLVVAMASTGVLLNVARRRE
ncbi:MAG: FtsW/RodA/SpoVE family cell cycle protein [Gemmatimonadota bacterium]